MRPYTYIRAGSRTPTRAYVRPGLVYMAGSERRNCIVVVFMGRQRNASRSSGGNGTRGSQPAWTEQPMETRPGVPQNGGNGLVFDRPCSKRDPVHREGYGVPQNGGNRPPTVETRVLFIGRVGAYRKTGLHGILFISTVDPLQPPRATVHPPSTSSSLHLRLFIHGLLFIQPPPRATPPATVQPPLHGLLFIQPSTVYCSSSPPRGGPVHPALHGVLFIQPQPARSIGVPFIPRQHHGVPFIQPP